MDNLKSSVRKRAELEHRHANLQSLINAHLRMPTPDLDEVGRYMQARTDILDALAQLDALVWAQQQ